MYRHFIACLTLAAAGAALAQQQEGQQEGRQQQQGQQAQPAEQGYPLSQGATAMLGNGASVTLDRVDDSRCPAGVMCTRAGSMAYHFILRAGERTERFTLSDDTPSYASVLLGGTTLSVDPGPAPDAARESEPKPPHQVTLQVARR